MGLLAQLFSGKDENPPAPQPVQVLASSGRVVALLPSGRVGVWDTESGELLWHLQAAGPRLAIQGDRVLDGHGVCRDLHSGEVLWESGQAGLPTAWGERLALLGWHRLWVEGQPAHQTLETLDPSPDLQTFEHQGRLLGIDPDARCVFWLDLDSPALETGAEGPPIRGGRLGPTGVSLIRERQGEIWPLDLSQAEALPRWHDQLLSLGEGCSLGVQAGRYRALDHQTDQSWALPGEIPNLPALLRVGDVLVAETWQGLALCRPNVETPEQVQLPLGRRKSRPISAHTPIVQSGPTQVALAAWPPLLVDVPTARRVPVLAPPPNAH